MKTSPIPPLTLWWVFSCIFSPLLAQPKLTEFDWKTIQLQGIDYVSMLQLMEFYQLDNESDDASVLTLKNQHIDAQFKVHSQNVKFNGVRLFLSDPIQQKNNTLYLSKLDLTSLIDPIFHPHNIKKPPAPTTIIIDAGHGGNDRGASNQEAHLTLSLAKQLQESLNKLGHHTLLTRSKEVTLPLNDRIKIINAEKNALVVSLHFNTGPDGVHGMETYIVNAKHPLSPASAALGYSIHANIMHALNAKNAPSDFKTTDRGIRHAKFTLLTQSHHPAILIELGFLTHKPEAQKITNPTYQKTLIKALTTGITHSVNPRK